MRSRRWPTLPRSLERSTIGAVGLNDRVRNGNGCGPYALTASNSCSVLTFHQPVPFECLDMVHVGPAGRGTTCCINISSSEIGCEQRSSTAEAVVERECKSFR